MSGRIIMTKGLPASGKSTWARQQIADGRADVRVNKDDLREMCHNGKWSKTRESEIIAIRDAIVTVALAKGRSVIVDDTNLHPKHEQQLRLLAKNHDAAFEVAPFDVDVDTCVERDAKRTNSVGEKVIRDMWRQFMRVTPEPQDASLPPVIIVDIDGTLAIMGDRSPYDDHLAEVDTLNVPVAAAMFAWLDSNPIGQLIVMSGRDEGRSREVTERWLESHGIYSELLLMRPAGDVRKDSVVKRELYEQHIKGKYYVVFVLDDRNQVVRMWRDELGLTCLQVADGDF